MKRLLINTELPEEKRIIVVEDGLVTDYETELEGQEQQKGNIYRATIERVEPSLEAAFVKLPGDRNGFLPFREIGPDYLRPAEGGKPVAERIASGDKLLVQVTKEKRDGKGAALTTDISLSGCYLVLMPTVKGKTQVSRNAARESRGDAQDALKDLLGDRDMSLILRTAGLECDPEDLRWDLESYLLKIWGLIRDAYERQKENTLIYAENNLIQKAIREYFKKDVDEIVCDTPSVHEELKGLLGLMMPEFVDRVKFHEGPAPLVGLKIESQIRAVHSRTVRLPSGGRVVFDSTEALVAVDVNSAQATKEATIEDTARKTNLEAAAEVARQLKLRDLGGLVVVDFIDMDTPAAREQVEQQFRRELKKDRARIRVVGISALGLVELSRQRIRQSVESNYQAACTRCHGTGRIQTVQATSIEVVRAMREGAMEADTDALIVTCPVDVQTTLLNEKRIEVRRLEDLHNVSITVIPDPNLQTPNYHIKSLSRLKRRDADLLQKVSYRMNDQHKDQALRDYLDHVPAAAPAARPVVEQVTPGERRASGNGAAAKGAQARKGDGVIRKVMNLLFGPSEGEDAGKAAKGRVPAQPGAGQAQDKDADAPKAGRRRSRGGRGRSRKRKEGQENTGGAEAKGDGQRPERKPDPAPQSDGEKGEVRQPRSQRQRSRKEGAPRENGAQPARGDAPSGSAQRQGGAAQQPADAGKGDPGRAAGRAEEGGAKADPSNGPGRGAPRPGAGAPAAEGGRQAEPPRAAAADAGERKAEPQRREDDAGGKDRGQPGTGAPAGSDPSARAGGGDREMRKPPAPPSVKQVETRPTGK